MLELNFSSDIEQSLISLLFPLPSAHIASCHVTLVTTVYQQYPGMLPISSLYHYQTEAIILSQSWQDTVQAVEFTKHLVASAAINGPKVSVCLVA